MEAEMLEDVKLQEIFQEWQSCYECAYLLYMKEEEFFDIHKNPILLKSWLHQIQNPLSFMQKYRYYKRNDMAISHFINQVELHLIFLDIDNIDSVPSNHIGSHLSMKSYEDILKFNKEIAKVREQIESVANHGLELNTWFHNEWQTTIFPKLEEMSRNCSHCEFKLSILSQHVEDQLERRSHYTSVDETDDSEERDI